MNCGFEKGGIYHLIAHWRIESGAGKNGIRVLVSMGVRIRIIDFEVGEKICCVMSYSTPPRIYDTSLLLLSGTDIAAFYFISFHISFLFYFLLYFISYHISFLFIFYFFFKLKFKRISHSIA